jgi:hypothetical protein
VAPGQRFSEKRWLVSALGRASAAGQRAAAGISQRPSPRISGKRPKRPASFLVIQVSLSDSENSNTYEYQEPPTCDTTRTATA